MKVYNTCCKVSNYCTGELEEVLNQYADYGFNLVSTLIAKNECDIDVMYLFFIFLFLVYVLFFTCRILRFVLEWLVFHFIFGVIIE